MHVSTSDDETQWKTLNAKSTSEIAEPEQVDELEDPFAAWESIELLKSAAGSPRAKDSFGNDLVERELVSIVLRMSRHLPNDKPAAKKLHDGVLDYLRRKGLMPSPLRAGETVVQSAADEC